MALPDVSLRQLLEAGVHFGHQTQRWNPKMAPYIYGDRNGIHIFDLTQTVERLNEALRVVHSTVKSGGRVLFVGTKRQAQKPVAEAAERAAQYYVNFRWLGGTLTNWKTISNSISRLKSIDEAMSGGAQGLTKKERLNLERQQNKLNAALGGIREMGGAPDLMFIVDTNKESLAVAEAKKLGIPVVAVVDSNSNPDDIDYPIPGNDDAGRAVALYCDLIARAALEGMAEQLDAAGVDIGAAEIGVEEELASENAAETPAEAPKAEEKAVKVETKPSKKAAAKAPAQPAKEAPKNAEADVEADSGTKPANLLSEAQGEPDDLKLISGVGPKLEELLHSNGVFHFWQVAEWNKKEIAYMDDQLSFKGRIERDDWIKQATKLADEAKK